jgi:hypothetical protein
MSAYALIQAAAADDSVPLAVTIGLPVLGAVVLSPLTSLITFRLVKRRELAAELENEVKKDEELTASRDRHELEERIREETLRWAVPILSAVDDLRHRLRNLLRSGYPPLDPTWQPTPEWSITHEYFLTSTMYLFAAYFGYTELLTRSLSLEFFRSQKDKDKLYDALKTVTETANVYPAPDEWPQKPGDCQLFRLQQRAIGELTAVWDSQAPRCLTYPEFMANLADPLFAAHFEPLRALIIAIKPNADGRWVRLTYLRTELDNLAKVCRALLVLPEG